MVGRNLHSIQKFYAHTNWIELGHEAPFDFINEVLGNIAGPDVDTCDGADLITDQLTSGYQETPETNASKCLHGDATRDGINKDTSSPCFSTFYDLHAQAASLAEDATFQYLELVRKTLQNQNFMSLLDLSFGSALAIVLDTSGSMDQEIEAVKTQIIQIIDQANSGGTRPSIYVLDIQYPSDEVTVTKDEKVVKELVSGLTTIGGDEYHFTAIKAVLANSPDRTDILVFTDERGDDLEEVDSAIALAKAKSSKVNVIWTDETIDAEALKNTCSQTGGVFIESSKADVDDIVALLSQSIQTSKATLSLIGERSQESQTDIHVDNSIAEDCYRIGIKLTGSLQLAQLATPDGSIFLVFT